MIIWRFARFWAMAEGILPPENMLRCMTNQYSGLSFWRSWHRSFNQWLIRYIYIPLGGRAFLSYNIWVIFLFVAFWHDRTAKLFTWGFLICLFITPELLLNFCHQKYFPNLRAENPLLFRLAKGIFASINIYCMAIANIVGFVIGDLTQMKTFLRKVFEPNFANLTTFILSFCCIFASTQVMFEIRESERRRGIYLQY